MGDAQLHQIDGLSLDVGELALALEHYAIVAVGEVPNDQGGRVDAAGRRYGEGIHIGHHAAIKATGRVLVDGLHIVVDLHHIDLDVVLVGPLFHYAALGRIVPGHPAGVDGPGDLELLLGLGCRDRAQQQQR